jgi:hypothetical protein
MVNSQSRNVNLAHRGSCCWRLMKFAKGALYETELGDMSDVRVEREVGNDVMKGVYSDR